MHLGHSLTIRCDADPAVMSDYIVALLKHDAQMSPENWKEVGCHATSLILLLMSSLSRVNWWISWKRVSFDRLRNDQKLMAESRPFVDLLFDTLQNKTFMPAPPAISAPAPAVSQLQAQAPAFNPASTGPAAVNPAVVSSFRPSVPFNAPRGPASMQQPVAGPSTVRQNLEGSSGFKGSNGMEGLNAEVEMGEHGHGQKQKCRDYHGQSAPGWFSLADVQNVGSVCAVSTVLSSILSMSSFQPRR